jgi:hypothetical protein
MTLRARDRRTRQLIRYIRDKADLLSAYDPRRAAIRSQSVGALALGAVAIGALAIGALAIGKLAIGRARIKRLEIDELVVRQLHVNDELHVPSKPDLE